MPKVRNSFDSVVVGGGLVGSLLAVSLQQRGHQVHIFEKRPDMRTEVTDGGRSINLVATSRALHALEEVGLCEEVLALSIPVYGRMIHDISGDLIYQSYSKDNTECNYSVSRAELNKAMLTCAEKAGAKVHFSHSLEDADFSKGALSFNTPSGAKEIGAKTVFGTDGSASAVRQTLVKQGHLEDSVDFLEHGYKELLIPPGPDGTFQIEKNALHIWPRGAHMLMALPNLDGGFTVTLYLANEGEDSFAALDASGPSGVKAFFQKYYADAIPLIPDVETAFFANPTGLLGTVRSRPWHFQDKVALLGDAAHGVVPFFGQGMNAGFENASVLMGLLERWKDDQGAAFAAYSEKQKPNGDAIADMAIENFIEMRDHVGDQMFLLQKEVEGMLGRAFPELYLSRYSMVTHTLIPYALAQQAGVLQNRILETLCADITEANQVDIQRAKQLITEQFSPFVEKNDLSW